MNTPTKSRFLRQMRELAVQPTNSYIRVYPSLVKFFKDRKEINRDDFVVGASFTYSWMQTVLALYGADEDWVRAAGMLNRAKLERISTAEDLNFLVSLIHHSFIGVSKVLHFVNPEKHAIWDGRVYRYLTEEEPSDYRVNKLGKYVRYHEICDEMAEWPEMAAEVARLSKFLDQELTTLRAIELTMWVNGERQ